MGLQEYLIWFEQISGQLSRMKEKNDNDNLNDFCLKKFLTDLLK